MTTLPLQSFRPMRAVPMLPALTLILLLGAVIRGVNLGVQPLWTDEGFSGFAVMQPDLLEVLRRDVHPPLYFAVLKAWAGLTGVSELALRWFSLLASVMSIAVMMPLAREVALLRMGGARLRMMPVLAALLMAVAEMEFYIAQEVRSYSLHVLLAMVSTWGFLRWVRTARRPMALVWVLSMTALVYTHYLGAWMGVVHGLYALMVLRGGRRWAAVGLLAASAALFSVWLVLVVLPYQLAKADSDATIDPSTLQTLVWYAHSYLTQQWPLMLGLLILGLGTVRDGRWQMRPPQATLLLVLWIVVPVMLTFIGNLRFSIMTYYRISLITPALVLLWALGLTAFGGWARAFLVAVVVVYGTFNVDFYRPKFPEREFAALASQFVVPGEAVLIDMKGADFSPYYYLLRQVPPAVTVDSLRQYAIWDSAGLYDELLPRLYARPAVWVLRWNDEPAVFDLMRRGGFIPTAHRIMRYDGHVLEALRFDPRAQFRGVAPLTEFGPLALRRARFDREALRLDLWWSVPEPLPMDLTTSAIVLNERGEVVAQYDSGPFLGERPTSTWPPRTVMFEPKPMRLLDGRSGLPAGRYQVAVQVYQWLPDGTYKPFVTADGQPYHVVEQFDIPAP
jgi:hypothetical protein